MDLGPASSTCPVCRMADQTQPVQGIVASQTAYSTAYVRGYRAHGASSTSLAQLLAFPQVRPPRGMLTAGWILTLIGVPLAALFTLVALYARHNEAHPAPAWASVMAPLFMTLPLWLPGLLLIVIAGARKRRLRREAPLRDMAWRVWSTARYCFRDHVVFLPHGAHAPANLARSLIFDTAQRALSEPYAPPELMA